MPVNTEERRALYRRALLEERRQCEVLGKSHRIPQIDAELRALDPVAPKKTGFDEPRRDDVKVAQPEPPKEPRRGRSRGSR